MSYLPLHHAPLHPHPWGKASPGELKPTQNTSQDHNLKIQTKLLIPKQPINNKQRNKLVSPSSPNQSQPELACQQSPQLQRQPKPNPCRQPIPWSPCANSFLVPVNENEEFDGVQSEKKKFENLKTLRGTEKDKIGAERLTGKSAGENFGFPPYKMCRLWVKKMAKLQSIGHVTSLYSTAGLVLDFGFFSSPLFHQL